MLTPGGTLGGRYRLDERIATGGMGDVWKAEDTVLGRTVAVKILQSALLEEPGFVERFRAEARVMATINHPGVVRVYDYGETEVDGGGTVAYLVMEHVDGEALSRTLGRVGRLTPDRTMNLLAQAGDALHAAHEHGIVHRDVKPGNLLVRPDGKLVLTDFGIARSAMSGQLTTAGSILGTASYVSPEQASGSSAITPASDVYSLGVVGYQCLSGHRPFEGDNPVQVAMKHIRDVPQPLPADVPPGAREVVERAMAKDPGQRWPSAAVMADASRRVAGGGQPTGALGAAPPGGPDRTAMMPAASTPTSGPGTGNFSRGAAAIPAAGPGRAPDDGYTTSMPPEKRGRGLLVAGVIIAALLVLGGLGGLGYALLSGDGESGADGSNTPSASSSASASQGGQSDEIRLAQDAYLHQPYDQAAQDATNKGLKVQRATRPADGYQAGTVTGWKLPNGNPAHRGDTIILYVQPGDDGNDDGNGNHTGMPSFPGNGDGNDDGGNDDSQTPPPSTPPTTAPSTVPPTGPSQPTGLTGSAGTLGGGFAPVARHGTATVTEAGQ